VELRREKMKSLKEELSTVGASLSVPDVDLNQLTGMRRLRLLHSRANKDLNIDSPATKEKSPLTNQDNIKAVKIEESVSTNGSVKTTTRSVSVLRVLAENDQGLFGLSRTATVLIFLGVSVFVILVSYLTYKYITWKPKMVARKGYRAVTRSKGLDVADSDAGAESSGGRTAAPALIVAGKT
jgi:hypothetical protein